MAFITGQGFMPYLLKSIEQAVGQGAAPNLKIDHVGLLRFLNENKRKIVLNNGSDIQQVQVAYKKRWNSQFTQTTDDCTTSNLQPKAETAVNLNNYRQLAIALDDKTVQQYETEYSQVGAIGMPNTGVYQELIEEIKNAADGLLTAVNADLWALLPTGSVNRRSGNTIDTINLTNNITDLPLTDGLTQIREDMMENLFGAPTAKIIGSGLISNFFQQQMAKTAGFNGLNTTVEAKLFDFYFDQQAKSLLGSNQAITVDDGALQLVEFHRFVGPFAGPRMGNSFFGGIVLPMQLPGSSEIKDVYFDFQLIYNTCATTLNSGYYSGQTFTISRGYNLILRKEFGLFSIPADAYRNGTDPMYGNRGFLNYSFTNN